MSRPDPMADIQPGTALPWNLNPGNETEIMAVKFNIARAHCGGMTGVRIQAAEANAAYIVHACNSYPALTARVAELEGNVLRAIDACGGTDCASKSADWNRGYDEALRTVDAEVRRLFARTILKGASE